MPRPTGHIVQHCPPLLLLFIATLTVTVTVLFYDIHWLFKMLTSVVSVAVTVIYFRSEIPRLRREVEARTNGRPIDHDKLREEVRQFSDESS